jgi:RHS repeat-associated protein
MKNALLLRFFSLSLLLLGTTLVHAAVGDMTTLAVSAGGGHALALRSDGTVWAWGDNTYGQLGVPTVAFSEFPLQVAGLSNIVSVSAGAAHSLAVQSNGQVWAWGLNNTGQLGTSNFTTSLTPTNVIGITNAVAVSAGGDQEYGSHSMALLSNGTAMAWGYNEYGQVGNEGGFEYVIVPVTVYGLSNVTQISAGGLHSMAVLTNGQVWCWGYGGAGEVGNGSSTSYTNATQTLGVSNTVAIAAGAFHSMALRADGTVWAWGENANGQLGIGSTNNTATATEISTLSNVTAIGAGAFSSSATVVPTALTGTNGQSYVWGSQYFTTPYGLAQAAPFTQLAPGYEWATGNDYFFGLTASGAVYAWGINDEGEFGDGNASNPLDNPSTLNFDQVPTLSFTPTPVSQWGEFIRGDLDDLDYCTIVVPIDLEQGVPLNATGNNQYSFTNSKPWFLSTSNQTLLLAEALLTGTNLVTYPVANPMVAFGSQGNGSPLFVNTPYRFGVYAGGMDESTGAATNVIQISVYDATKFTNGVTTNMAPTNVYTITLPQRTVAAESNAWVSFMTNGASTTFASNGLTTTVSFLDNGDPNNKPFGLTLFSTNNETAQTTNFDLVGYTLTHTASGTNFFYKIAVLGKVQVATNKLAPMATNSAGVWTAAPLYTLDFQQPSPLQSMYVDRLFFQGTPMPPTYEDTTAPGPAGLTILVTNIVSLTNSVYTNIDGSPELRNSPILNQFVSQMNNDPLALASYVINEIGLTDLYAEAQASQVVATDINCGGIDRSAQATFLEGQGSPIEQCALLVYLLRQAGYPAAYVFPTNGNLLMSDTHISQLWRMQVNGVLNVLGIPYITTSFLTVDYPWVVANIGTNTVHIFPWIKDTKIVQGVNLYSYMPTNYSTALAWVEQYVRANSNIMSLNSENLPAVLFPAFVQQCLLTNEEGASISLDDVGVTAYDRPHQFPTWSYLPQPDMVTNLSTLAIVDSLTDSATTYPFLSNVFNTAEIKVYNTTGSTSNLLFDTGVWDSCDFHDRKLLLFTNNSQVCLWMAPYRTNVTTVTTFSNGAPSSTALQSNSVAASGITNLMVDVIHKRRVAYLSQPAIYFPITETMGTTNISHCFTYEVAGIALDFGRVTSTMLQQYEDFYWNLQRERAATNTFVPPVQDYQGTAAYLLAMGYYQKNDAFDALNQQWHGVRGLVDFHSGLGTVGNAKQTNMQARVDMIIEGETIIANGTFRPDSGVPDFTALQNYYTLSIVNGSAQEHDILQTMFPDQNAVSTVRLLQLAQLRATNGNSAILELVNNNYIAQGNATHTGYGSTALKSISPPVWTTVTNAFNEVDGTYARALVTPGLVTNKGASFGGMGALTLSYENMAAVISSNSIVFNGGFGSVLNSFTTTGSSSTFTYNLTVNPDGSLSFTYNNPSGGNVDPAFSPVDSAGLTQDTITPTTSQDNLATVVSTVTGQPAPTTPQTTLFDLLVAANNGFDGTAVGWPQSAGEPVEDPVDPVSGGFYVDAVDLTLPGPFPLQLRRNYLSQNPSANQFGYGWKMNFMPYLVLTTNLSSQSVIYAAEMNGVVVAFHQTNTSDPWVVLPQDNPSLNNNSSAGKGGTANLFNSVMNFYNTNGSTYIISAPDGSTRTYSEMTFAVVNGTNTMNRTRPYLTLWQDHSGNYAQFLYDSTSTDDAYGQLNRINMANGNDFVFKYDFYGRIIQAFSGDGRFVQYQYDNYGDLINVILPDNTKCQYQYQHYNFLTTNGSTVTTNIDSTHLMIQEIKPNGRIVANNYDSLDRVTNQMSTVGTNLVLVTNAYFFYTNNITNLTNQFATGSTLVQDVFHNPTVYYYSNNLITNIVDPYGYSTKQVWFPDTTNGAPGYYPRSLQYTVDKRGLTNQFFYNSSGCVTQLVVSGDLTGEGILNQTATTVYTYTANNLPLTTTNPVNNGMQLTYDSVDPFKLVQELCIGGGAPVATNYLFYTNVSQLSTIGTTNYAFGLCWRKVRAGATNDFSYNGNGFMTAEIQYPTTGENPWITDPEVITYFSYNERGQMYQQQVAGGGTTQFDYDAMGRTTSRQIFDQNNNSLSREFYYYNQNGELSWYAGPRFNPQDYIYYVQDGAGRVIQEIRWRTQGMLNGAGVEAPDGNNQHSTTFNTFDGFGNHTSTTDARGVLTTNLFDALGRPVQTQVFETNGNLLTSAGFAYEPGDKVSFNTNALGGVTQTLYTQTGQPYYRQTPDGATNGWTYYLDGRPKNQYLANGSFWQTTYNDAAMQATHTFYSAGGTPLATNVVGLDGRGNQILRVDELGNSFTNGFDGLNRVKFTAGPLTINIQTNLPSPSGSSSQTNSYQKAFTNYFDAAGLATTNVNALGESTITYRDALGRVTDKEIHDASNNLVRITTTTYSADHQSQTVTQGSGATAIVKTIYTDNADKPVLTISYPSSGVEEFTLDRYDLVENLISETHNTVSGGTVTTWTTAAFANDGLNRVTSKTDRDGAVTTYAYDPAGNRTNMVMPGGLIWRAAYNNALQMQYDCDVGSGSAVTRSNSYTYYSTTGLLQTKTDGRGVICTHYFDAFLRPSSNVYSGPLPEHNMTTAFSYDPRSTATNISESFASTNTGPGVSVARTLDPYGQLVSDALSGGAAYAASQSWDSAGRRTGLGMGIFGWSFSWRADRMLLSVGGSGGSTGGGNGAYSYDMAGQLLTRTFSPRMTTITQRDGDGRPTAAYTTVNGATVLNETLSFTGDGLLAGHTLVRPDFTDSRSYTYANYSRRLTQEIVGLAANSSWTNVFAYDHGVAGGPGVLTSNGQAVGTNVVWRGGTDAFSRVNAATNSVAQREAYGRLNGTATMTALLDGNPMPVTIVGTNDAYEWQAQLALQPGAHKLIVNALNWSGYYTASATNTFTNNAADRVQNTYSGNGEVTNRAWISSNGQTNATQSLSWDARDRLHGVTYLDSNTNGYIWSAIYDPLGRRMSTTTIFITNGVTVSSLPKTIAQYYDPNVKFLELGESDSGTTTWKICGPDVNGVYGGMQGVGGLEAVGNAPEPFSSVISDIRGNGYAVYNVSQASLTWFASRPTAYGAVPGYQPLPLADGATMAPASAWRGKWADITGFFYLGNRYYDPIAGNWLGADPLGHDADPALHAFCGGDPVNSFDPLGLLSSAFNADGTAATGYRSTTPFLTLQYSAWTLEEGADALWNTLVAGLFTPDGMNPQNTVNTIGNPFLSMGAYTPSQNNQTWQQLSAQTGQAGQNLLYAFGTPMGQESPDVTIPEQTPETESTGVTSPNATMRANANASGTYIDPLTGETVSATGTLAADHIVPQSWIIQQPGFDTLTPEQQSSILNDPINTQGLPQTFNSSKGAQLPGSWTTYKGTPLNPSYVQNDAIRGAALKLWIQTQINNYNQANASTSASTPNE